jgi:hypothetical protein
MAIVVQRLKKAVKQHFPAFVPLLRALRSRPGKPSKPSPRTVPLPIGDVFSRVYQTNYWGNAESRSGNGSDLKQTEVIRAEIPKLMRDLGLRSILDIPCGDFFWMQQCDLGIESYIGADIVPSMIAELNARHRNAHRSFEVLDLTKDTLPKVDLVLCRDVLVHFSLSDIRRVVINLKRSGSSYLLTTTFTDRNQNLDIATSGDWRPLNLQLAPISFPKPLQLINERCTEYNNEFMDKSLGLWRLFDL